MKLNWIDIILILLGLFIAYQLLKGYIWGSWQTESLIIALLIFNLSLTWKLNMNFERHMVWHRVVDKRQSLQSQCF